MQRIRLTATPYSFAKPWLDAELFAVKAEDGWLVYFPHALGLPSQGEGAPKNAWFHGILVVCFCPTVPSH